MSERPLSERIARMIHEWTLDPSGPPRSSLAEAVEGIVAEERAALEEPR